MTDQSDLDLLVDDMIEQHGGRGTLSVHHIAVIRKVAVLLLDDGAPNANAISQLLAMLPGQAEKGVGSTTIYINPEFNDDQLQLIASAIRTYNPGADGLSQLLEDNIALRSRIDRAADAFYKRDFNGLIAALLGSAAPWPDAPPAAEAVPAIVPSQPAVIPPSPPKPASPEPSAGEPRAPLQAGQGVFDLIARPAPGSGADRFSFGGRGA
jgi:hypothetical protein